MPMSIGRISVVPPSSIALASGASMSSVPKYTSQYVGSFSAAARMPPLLCGRRSDHQVRHRHALHRLDLPPEQLAVELGRAVEIVVASSFQESAPWAFTSEAPMWSLGSQTMKNAP